MVFESVAPSSMDFGRRSSWLKIDTISPRGPLDFGDSKEEFAFFDQEDDGFLLNDAAEDFTEKLFFGNPFPAFSAPVVDEIISLPAAPAIKVEPTSSQMRVEPTVKVEHTAQMKVEPAPAAMVKPVVKVEGVMKRSMGRKKTPQRRIGTVLSTIKSNRAKPAEEVVCDVAPKKELRVKGLIYKIGASGERRRWDGRQWRRLCVVLDCCSAARGSTAFCICHGRGELTKAIIENEEVEILKPAEQPVQDAALALKKKRRSVDESNDRLHKVIKTMEMSSISSEPMAQCQFVTALGDQCGNTLDVLNSSGYCKSCMSYVEAAQEL